MSETQKVRIMEVCDVDATREDGQIRVKASGLVSSGGWSNGDLALLSDTPNAEILDFMFVAEPPTGFAIQVISQIDAQTVINDDGRTVSCVSVHAMRNSETDCL